MVVIRIYVLNLVMERRCLLSLMTESEMMDVPDEGVSIGRGAAWFGVVCSVKWGQIPY